MKIEVTEQQRKIILKAILNISVLYDFENTSEKEFKETYEVSKAELKKETNKLSEILRR